MTFVDNLNGINEARPGNYIFFDAFQATLGSCRLEDCALTVLAAVIHSNRTEGKIVLDAGAIALSKDRGAFELNAACGYGKVLDLYGNDLDLNVDSLSQEHGVIHTKDEKCFQSITCGFACARAGKPLLSHKQHNSHTTMCLKAKNIVDRWERCNGW
jgi:D-serine deaminase-like pyridoxal phosphate-dependent protein